MKYRVNPCIHSKTGEKGWKIVEDGEYPYSYSPDGKTHTVYFNYMKAEDMCRHLNGGSQVYGPITQSSWEILKGFVRGYWK